MLNSTYSYTHVNSPGMLVLQNITLDHCYALKKCPCLPFIFLLHRFIKSEAIQCYINQIAWWLLQLLFLPLSFPAFPLLTIYLNTARVRDILQLLFPRLALHRQTETRTFHLISFHLLFSFLLLTHPKSLHYVLSMCFVILFLHCSSFFKYNTLL